MYNKLVKFEYNARNYIYRKFLSDNIDKLRRDEDYGGDVTERIIALQDSYRYKPKLDDFTSACNAMDEHVGYNTCLLGRFLYLFYLDSSTSNRRSIQLMDACFRTGFNPSNLYSCVNVSRYTNPNCL